MYDCFGSPAGSGLCTAVSASGSSSILVNSSSLISHSCQKSLTSFSIVFYFHSADAPLAHLHPHAACTQQTRMLVNKVCDHDHTNRYGIHFAAPAGSDHRHLHSQTPASCSSPDRQWLPDIAFEPAVYARLSWSGACPQEQITSTPFCTIERAKYSLRFNAPYAGSILSRCDSCYSCLFDDRPIFLKSSSYVMRFHTLLYIIGGWLWYVCGMCMRWVGWWQGLLRE